MLVSWEMGLRCIRDILDPISDVFVGSFLVLILLWEVFYILLSMMICSFYTSILLACARTRVLTVALLVVFVAVKIEKRISASPS